MGKKQLAQFWIHTKHLFNISYYFKYYHGSPLYY